MTKESYAIRVSWKMEWRKKLAENKPGKGNEAKLK